MNWQTEGRHIICTFASWNPTQYFEETEGYKEFSPAKTMLETPQMTFDFISRQLAETVKE